MQINNSRKRGRESCGNNNNNNNNEEEEVEDVKRQRRVVSSKLTPLMKAAVSNDVGLARKLIAFGDDLNVRDPESGRTALLWAAVFESTEMIMALVLAGADRSARDKSGECARDIAMRSPSADVRSIFDSFLWRQEAPPKKSASIVDKFELDAILDDPWANESPSLLNVNDYDHNDHNAAIADDEHSLIVDILGDNTTTTASLINLPNALPSLPISASSSSSMSFI